MHHSIPVIDKHAPSITDSVDVPRVNGVPVSELILNRTRSKTDAKLLTPESSVSTKNAQLALLSGRFYCLSVEDELTEEKVLSSSESIEWTKAMHEEIDKLSKINTWTVVTSLPTEMGL